MTDVRRRARGRPTTRSSPGSTTLARLLVLRHQLDERRRPHAPRPWCRATRARRSARFDLAVERLRRRPRRAPDRPPARAERGAGRRDGVGQPDGRGGRRTPTSTAWPAPGTARHPGLDRTRRRAEARQRHGRRAQRRRRDVLRRRPERQVVDPDVRQPAHLRGRLRAGARTRATSRTCSTSASTRSACRATPGAWVGLKIVTVGGRRGRHRRPRPGPPRARATRPTS